MFCSLCGKPIPAGTPNNICQECSVTLNGSASRLRSNQPLATVAPDYNKPSVPPSNKVVPIPPQPSSYPRPATPYISTGPAEMVELCSICNRPFPINRLYKVQPRTIHIRPVVPTMVCYDDLPKLKSDWQKRQNFKPLDLIIGGAISLLLMAILSFIWSLGIAVTYQVITFVIMLIGWAGGKTLYYALGKRRGPTPGVLAAVVAFIGLLIALYLMYSDLSGETIASLSVFFNSISRNGVPFQTVIYFVVALLLAVAQCLELEPDVRDYQGNKISFSE